MSRNLLDNAPDESHFIVSRGSRNPDAPIRLWYGDGEFVDVDISRKNCIILVKKDGKWVQDN